MTIVATAGLINRPRMALAMTQPTQVEERLRKHGLELPAPPKPAATYTPWTRHGNTVYVSGQIPIVAGKVLKTGKVGQSVSLEEAQSLARACALNAVAVLKEAAAAAGSSLDNVRILKTVNFTAAGINFTDMHLVANGASELFILAFGDKGLHARSSVGVPELPLGVPFEVEVIAALE